MKSVGNLFDRIVERENLSAAAWAAAKAKRGRREVRRFFQRWPAEVGELSRSLHKVGYQFGEYREFFVNDTKRRMIHAPVFRDRVVHHAIVRVLGPVLERGAIHHSYACRKGKGQHAAVICARSWTRRSLWYGRMDVKKFYDSVDHDQLKSRLARRFRERKLLNLLESLIDSYQVEPGKGIPIGALTSQYFGNFFLDLFDRAISTHQYATHYLRYMDDAYVWTTSKANLAPIRSLATETLADMGLVLKNGGEWNRCSNGIPFLGFTIYPDRLRLNRSGKRRLRKKMVRLRRGWEHGECTERQAAAKAQSLFAHASVGDDKNWRREALRWHDFGDEPDPAAGGARRFLEQHGSELPFRVSQQERARQPEQEQRLPAGFGPRIDEDAASANADAKAEEICRDDPSSDGAHSRVPLHDTSKTEPTDKPPSRFDTRRSASRKARDGAPPRPNLSRPLPKEESP